MYLGNISQITKNMTLKNKIRVHNKLSCLITRKFSTNISKDVPLRYHKKQQILPCCLDLEHGF
jgi:hypothetical protein